MSLVSLWKSAAWMAAALIAESALLPHWVLIRWIPQVSFLILIFVSLRAGVNAGVGLGLALGLGQSFLSAIPGPGVVWVYAGLGALAGAARRLIFLESPLAQWLAPLGFGLLAEWVFFCMMPWDDAPLGWGEFAGLIRTSNLPITCLLAGLTYRFCRRALFIPKKS